MPDLASPASPALEHLALAAGRGDAAALALLARALGPTLDAHAQRALPRTHRTASDLVEEVVAEVQAFLAAGPGGRPGWARFDAARARGGRSQGRSEYRGPSQASETRAARGATTERRQRRREGGRNEARRRGSFAAATGPLFGTALSGWLYGIVRNKVRRRLRDAGRAAALRAPGAASALAGPAAPSPERAIDGARALALVAALPPRERAVLRLWLDDAPSREIADRLRFTSPHAVDCCLSRGKQRLRRMLEGEERVAA